MDSIVVVGMGCRYADASNPRELWETVLAGRRAFRRIPASRLRLDDYWSADRSAADRTYVTEAATITGFEFDRVRFKVSAAAHRAADTAHWLALDCAAAALADAGWPDGRDLLCDTAGVLLGNTLTGDQSRAGALRLRWPYVRRVVRAALAESGVPPDTQTAVLERASAEYLRPFPAMDEETLAGWLSNTIAGRICNHFGLHGGGYVVDGACASSLLAVSHACSALAAGDLDVALAGGVDLSLDPFELVGFARAGALAPDEMRVYDKRSGGFLPGEGCGFLVLMREADAIAAGRRIYAAVRGWGISSDGQGGLTRPEVAGQRLALQRAYRRAGYGIESVAYFEGHGTGTVVGDQVELAALAEARRAGGAQSPATVGSIKANIGHTKAAAGVAGMIKAILALDRQMLPPTTGCRTPREELTGSARLLETRPRAAPWPRTMPLRAGVSAMGFGGINTHVTLESTAHRRFTPTRSERLCLSADQDAELIVLSADARPALLERVRALADRASTLSRAELIDLAVDCQRQDAGGAVRAAVVTDGPAEFRAQLARLEVALQNGARLFEPETGVFAGVWSATPRVAFVFPGQGSPVNSDGGAWARRFARVRSLYCRASTDESGDGDANTRIAQEAIARASVAGLRVLRRAGVQADFAVGHSLGELVALHWSGALDEPALIRLARARGAAIADSCQPGAMASIRADADRVNTLLDGTDAVIAAFNLPDQIVVAGSAAVMAQIVSRARRAKIAAAPLPVRFAFHSALMRPAVPVLRAALVREALEPIARRVISTATGCELVASTPVRDHVLRHLLEPVRFTDAAAVLIRESDVAIEVGPGSILTSLLRQMGHPAALSVDAGGASLAPLLRAVGAAYAMGAPVRTIALAQGRFARPFRSGTPIFLTSPCEDAPIDECAVPEAVVSQPIAVEISPADSPLQTALAVVAARADLPLAAIRSDHRLLADLHFNSITVTQLVLDIAARIGAVPPDHPGAFADASIREVVEALSVPGAAAPAECVSGIEPWVRAFRPVVKSLPPLERSGTTIDGTWRVLVPEDHPLAADIAAEAARKPRAGTLVVLPSVPTTAEWVELFAAARDAVRAGRPGRFVVVHDAGVGMALAATLEQEAPHLIPVAIEARFVRFDAPRAAAAILDEAISADRLTRISLTDDGRSSIEFEVADGTGDAAPTLGSTDVIVVSGGARGSTAECALALATRTGAAIGLIGRADPDRDRVVADTIGRFRTAGIRVRYESADLVDREAVQRAVRRIASELGPVTGIVHGAAVNDPVLLADMTDEDVVRAFGAKVTGAEHLLDAVDWSRLRLFVAFGSVIARTGMRGEAHYGVANEALRLLVDRVAASHPACRGLTFEWSVWAGTGMGDRLGSLVGLERRGIMPLTIEQGVETFVECLCGSSNAGALIVSGRCGEALPLAGPPMPLARFLERPRAWYPRVEIVADAEVSLASDPYLADHVLDGEYLFPAVVGLEAMIQAAAALAGAAPGDSVRMRQIRFDQPIVVPRGGTRTIRVAAGQIGREIRVALRSDATGFAVDHFALTCEFGPTPPQRPKRPSSAPLNGARELYDEVLFQRGCFSRVAGYRQLDARHCVADILDASPGRRFGAYYPDSLWLHDPGVRDAALHAVQACIPASRLVPTGVDVLTVHRVAPGPRQVHAVERSHEGSTYVYELSILDRRGQLLEEWQGLRLRAIGPIALRAALPELLLTPWLERECAASGTRARRARPERLVRRADGRPMPAAQGAFASITHDAGRAIAIVAGAPVGCDLQHVAERSHHEWEQMLGPGDALAADYIAGLTGEPFDTSATRLWSAREALIKCGIPGHAPLLVEACQPPLIRLRTDRYLVSTLRVSSAAGESAFAVTMPRPGEAS